MNLKQKLIHSDESRVFFCSDLHYNHANVISLANRPFSTLDEMNSYLLREIKEKLRPEDILFSLGDVFWNLRKEECVEILSSIPCQFFQVMGNHDSWRFWRKVGKEIVEERGGVVADLLEIVVNDIPTTLSHYPILSWNLKHYGSYHLHGHCHGGMDSYNLESSDLRVDVGFDGSLAKSVDSFLIPWNCIDDHMKAKNNSVC